jgi:hypothetical protein
VGKVGPEGVSQDKEIPVIEVRCGRCNKFIRYKPANLPADRYELLSIDGGIPVSTGLCEECFKEQLNTLGGEG